MLRAVSRVPLGMESWCKKKKSLADKFLQERIISTSAGMKASPNPKEDNKDEEEISKIWELTEHSSRGQMKERDGERE